MEGSDGTQAWEEGEEEERVKCVAMCGQPIFTSFLPSFLPPSPLPFPARWFLRLATTAFYQGGTRTPPRPRLCLSTAAEFLSTAGDGIGSETCYCICIVFCHKGVQHNTSIFKYIEIWIKYVMEDHLPNSTAVECRHKYLRHGGVWRQTPARACPGRPTMAARPWLRSRDVV